MHTHPTLDRSKLDALTADARAKLAAREKAERWGAWMNTLDRELARITGEL